MTAHEAAVVPVARLDLDEVDRFELERNLELVVGLELGDPLPASTHPDFPEEALHRSAAARPGLGVVEAGFAVAEAHGGAGRSAPRLDRIDPGGGVLGDLPVRNQRKLGETRIAEARVEVLVGELRVCIRQTWSIGLRHHRVEVRLRLGHPRVCRLDANGEASTHG